MDMPKDFYDMVCADIKAIENSGGYPFQELIKLHRRVDARYQACIKDWYYRILGFKWLTNILSFNWHGGSKR